MKKIVALLAAFAAFTGAAYGSSYPTPTATQVAPLTVLLDASTSPCENVCSYSWRGFSSTSNRLGFTVGYGDTLTYQVSKPGLYAFVVTKSVRCAPLAKTYCPAYNTVYINVTA